MEFSEPNPEAFNERIECFHTLVRPSDVVVKQNNPEILMDNMQLALDING